MEMINMDKEYSKHNIENCINYAKEHGFDNIVIQNNYYDNRRSVIALRHDGVELEVEFYKEFDTPQRAGRFRKQWAEGMRSPSVEVEIEW